MEMSATISQLADALSKAQATITGAKKDSDNAFYKSKYADLESVWDACRDALTNHGLSVVQTPRTSFSQTAEIETYTSRTGEPRSRVKVLTTIEMTSVLLHTSGEWISGTLSSMLPNADPQSIGSACTYLRRYGLSALVGIASTDDDGNDANHPHGDDASSTLSQARKATPEQLPSVQPASLLTLTDAQQERLKALLKTHGVKATALKALVEKSYPIKTAADIRQSHYDDLCAWVIAGGK